MPSELTSRYCGARRVFEGLVIAGLQGVRCVVVGSSHTQTMYSCIKSPVFRHCICIQFVLTSDQVRSVKAATRAMRKVSKVASNRCISARRLLLCL